MVDEERAAPILSDPTLEADFQADGFAVAPFLGQADAAALSDTYASIVGPPKQGFQATVLDLDSGRRAAVDQAIRSIMAAPLERLLPGFRLCFCTFVTKAARSASSSVPLHQDWSFVDEPRYTSIGFWCPLVDVTAENGCLHVVAGSHRLPSALRGVSTPFAYPELLPALRGGLLRALPLRAGEGVLLHPQLFHGSPPNRSASVRVVVGGVLAPAHARLRYYHASDPTRPHVLDAFEVDDAFYLRHVPGRRPTDGTYLGTIEARAPKIDPQALTALLSGAPRGVAAPA